MLKPEDFADFFAAVNDGHRPFAWQQRLLDSIVATGRWPELISAPTGTGKSNVVDVHVFANALHAAGAGPRVPRRLSVVVNRRALVDQSFDHALKLKDILGRADAQPTVERVRDALIRLAPGLSSQDREDPLWVVSMRGGQPSTREWLDDPRKCVVICATPEMWGSRVLLRGYGSSQLSRPREAGLLALDSVVVVDEAHLARQFVQTATDIAELSGSVVTPLGVPTLQVVSTSATQVSDDVAAIAVEEQDVSGPDANATLARRLLTTKSLKLVVSSEQPILGKASAKYVEFLASRAAGLRGEVEERAAGLSPTIGVIVNHVNTAARVAQRLRHHHDLQVVAWVGRMRPCDLESYRRTFDGILSVRGNQEVDVIVTTQTAEVGVDLDFASLVTELAPAASLAQRFGRVNRLGDRDAATVEVVVPPRLPEKDRAPYAVGDLAVAYRWLHDLVDAGGDVSPWTLNRVERLRPPTTSPSRLAYSRVRPGNAEILAQTSVPHFQEADLAFWLRDDLTEDIEHVNIVVRRLPIDDASAASLVAELPPTDVEMLPGTIKDARSAVERVLTAADGQRARVFPWSPDDGPVLPRRDADDLSWLRPGSTIIIDASHRLVVENVLVDSDERELAELAPWEPPIAGFFARAGRAGVVIWGDEAVELLALDVEEQLATATELFGQPAEIIAGDGSQEDDSWAVIVPQSVLAEDEALRQEWSTSDHEVLLDDHCRDVAVRAQQFGRELGLTEALCQTLFEAGIWHDAGKADCRFQWFTLGSTRLLDEAPLAKSIRSTTRAVRRRHGVGLPRGWRHEQLSAALAWLGLERDHPRSRALVTRLAGTSHGWGRPFFPHSDSTLVGVDGAKDHQRAAESLFGRSQWHEVIELTEAEYGVWGCAFLEAVLRAADGTISKEGR